MFTKTIFKGAVVTLAGAVVGLVAIGGVSATAGLNRSEDAAPVFPRNANGMTYGSGLDAISPETEPDLILATGDGGQLGYVRSSDVEPSMPSSPEEALTRQQHATEQVVPLYAQDGVTVVGSFTMTAPDPSLGVVLTVPSVK